MSDDLQDSLSLAFQHHQEGRLAEAETLYRRVLEKSPDHAEALHFLGILMYQTEKQELAADLIGKSVKIDPEHSEAHYNLGNILSDLGRLDQAVAAFQRAISLNPNYAKAHYNLGVVFKDQNKWDAAEESFRRAIACDPNYARAHNNLGLALKELGKLDAASASFQRAIACDPNSAQAYNNLGIILKTQGKLNIAIAAYAKAIAIDSKYADAYGNLGIALKDGGKIDDAVAAFRRAIALDPNHIQAYYNLAGSLAEQGKVDDAIAAYKRTIELDPDNLSAKHLLTALKGETTEAAPSEYVKTLFDGYAEFEQHLVERLHYKTPTLLQQMLNDLDKKRFCNVVDLGCGTGLSGVGFRAFADRLTGIDLSPKMIEKAKSKNIYDALYAGEIVETLNKTGEKYDLFIAADVFVYIGNLESVFKTVLDCASGGAWFLFSVESGEEDYVLRKTGRYAHSEAYIRSLAKNYNFTVEICRSSELRKERQQWVMGYLFALKFSG